MVIVSLFRFSCLFGQSHCRIIFVCLSFFSFFHPAYHVYTPQNLLRHAFSTKHPPLPFLPFSSLTPHHIPHHYPIVSKGNQEKTIRTRKGIYYEFHTRHACGHYVFLEWESCGDGACGRTLVEDMDEENICAVCIENEAVKGLQSAGVFRSLISKKKKRGRKGKDALLKEYF